MGSRHHGRALRPAIGAALGFGLVAIATHGGPAQGAWDGTEHIRLGDTFGAEFAQAAGAEEHVFTFYAPEETRISAKTKGAPGLATLLSVLDSGGAAVDTGTAVTGGTLKPFLVPERGAYGFRLVSTAGTGVYRTTTKAVWPKLLAGQVTTNLTFSFGAPLGTVADVIVRAAKGSAARPTVTKISGPLGDVAGVPGGTPILRKLALPGDGTYVVTIANSGTADAPIDVSVKIRPPKAGRVWGFGTVTPGRGTISAIRADWLTSGHAARGDEAFAHWDAATPPVVQADCAKCHSGTGYVDFVRDGDIDAAPAVGVTVECATCHDPAAVKLTSVTFPSGAVVSGLGDEARCMVCHQGRESTVSVDTAITTALADPANAGKTDDSVFPSSGTGRLSFRNVHYFAAAASLFGREARGAYEYAGGKYDKRFTHVASADACIECHDPHTLDVRIDLCDDCHSRGGTTTPVASVDDLRTVRMNATLADFDGDGDVTEGVWFEMFRATPGGAPGVADILYGAIRDYASQVAGAAIVYDAAAYPYFFGDANGNGLRDDGETSYASWTPRLLRACYDYQYVQKDPGAFAHNAKYLLQVLYDAVADLDASAITVAALPSMRRGDTGHFDTSADAFRRWDTDADALVDASCAKCHSIEGFAFRVKHGIDPALPAAPASGLSCETCHAPSADYLGSPARISVAKVEFPYPVSATSAERARVTLTAGAGDDSYVCMTCHSGRMGTLGIDAAIALATNPSAISFQNVHYLAAGGSQYGNWGRVGYQYTGKTYAGRWNHKTGNDASPVPASGSTWAVAMSDAAGGKCTYCHMPDGSHSFRAEVTADCAGCHGGVPGSDPGAIMHPLYALNFDGDPTTTTLKAEVAAFGARLWTAMRDYVTANPGTFAVPIGYDEHTHPYYFKDTDGSGVIEAGEATSANAFRFDAKLLRAAHNYQLFRKDPGLWAHNPKYALQILHDSIEDLGGSVAGLTRP